MESKLILAQIRALACHNQVRFSGLVKMGKACPHPQPRWLLWSLNLPNHIHMLRVFTEFEMATFKIWKHLMCRIRIVFYSQTSLVSTAQSNNHASIKLPPPAAETQTQHEYKIALWAFSALFLSMLKCWGRKRARAISKYRAITLVQSCAKAVMQG